jgi:hypothetical protein
LSEVYDSGGNKQFVLKIPAATGATKAGSPTGIAFNPSTTDFALPQGSAALFIFDSLDGTISAWNSSMTNAEVGVDNSASGAVYTGLTIDNNGTGNAGSDCQRWPVGDQGAPGMVERIAVARMQLAAERRLHRNRSLTFQLVHRPLCKSQVFGLGME